MQSRSRRFVTLIAVVLVLAGCGTFRRTSAAPDLVKITILQINDAYALEPVDLSLIHI